MGGGGERIKVRIREGVTRGKGLGVGQDNG